MISENLTESGSKICVWKFRGISQPGDDVSRLAVLGVRGTQGCRCRARSCSLMAGRGACQELFIISIYCVNSIF